MLGWLLLALPLVLILLLLLPPIDIIFEGRLDERGARQRAILRCLGLQRELKPGGSKPRPPAARGRRVNALAMLRTEGALNAVRRLARRLWGSMRVRLIRLRARIGLSDPAETGMAIGALAPLFVLMPATRGVSVELAADYERERLDVALDAHVRIWPLLAVAAFVAFLCTPAVWRAARAGRRA